MQWADIEEMMEVYVRAGRSTGDEMSRVVLEIPPGTSVFEPDGINRVTFMFKTQDQAIIFFEQVKQPDLSTKKRANEWKRESENG